MDKFITITPYFSVSGQINEDDLTLVRAMGFCSVLNNRPDHEHGPAQTGGFVSKLAEQTVRAQGLQYHYLPVDGLNVSDDRLFW